MGTFREVTAANAAITDISVIRTVFGSRMLLLLLSSSLDEEGPY
jgi:hypothetical protein